MEKATIMIGCSFLYRNMALVKEQLTRVNLQLRRLSSSFCRIM